MPTDAWFKTNPKVSAYVHPVIYDHLIRFKDERGISMSEAVTIILCEHFGIGGESEQLSLRSETLAAIQDLESKLSSLSEMVEQRLQELENVNSKSIEEELTSLEPRVKALEEVVQKQKTPQPPLPTPTSLPFVKASQVKTDKAAKKGSADQHNIFSDLGEFMKKFD